LKKFLIVNPFGIGDVLFTTPVIKAIKESEPDSFIGYWCNERVRDVLKDNPGISTVFALSRGDLKKIYRKSMWEGLKKSIDLKKRIKQEKFDSLLDFSLDPRYSLIAKRAGIRRRIGFNYKNRGRFLTDKIDLDSYSSKHVVDYYLDLLRLIGVKAPLNPGLEIFVPQGAKTRVKGILLGHGINPGDLIIGIAPGAGASWGVDAYLKHWPAIKFGQLADKIIEDLKAKAVILGDEPEKPVIEKVINGMRNKPLNLAGKLTLEELIAVINELNILVTNDGGPLHIAVALGKKTVSFFGPVDPKVYGPYPFDERRQAVLKKDLQCSPCYINFRLSDCKRKKECLETIDVSTALDAVTKLLKMETD